MTRYVLAVAFLAGCAGSDAQDRSFTQAEVVTAILSHLHGEHRLATSGSNWFIEDHLVVTGDHSPILSDARFYAPEQLRPDTRRVLETSGFTVCGVDGAEVCANAVGSGEAATVLAIGPITDTEDSLVVDGRRCGAPWWLSVVHLRRPDFAVPGYGAEIYGVCIERDADGTAHVSASELRGSEN